MDDSLKKPLPSVADLRGKALPVRKIRHKVDRFCGEKSGKTLEPYFFTPAQIKFMEVYAETLDAREAAKESGIQLRHAKANAYLRRECAFIEEAAKVRHRMKADITAGKHFLLMDKFERDYDTAHDSKTKVGLASTLARMSGDAMKAGGVFQDNQDSNVAAVQVVINMPEPDQAPVIDVNGS